MEYCGQIERGREPDVSKVGAIIIIIIIIIISTQVRRTAVTEYSQIYILSETGSLRREPF